MSHNLLDMSILASEAKWKKLKLEDCIEEALKEELDDVLCCCLEEESHSWSLDDLCRLAMLLMPL